MVERKALTETFGASLSILIEDAKAKGVKPAYIADALYVSPNYLWELANGRKNPSLLTAVRLAEYFGESLDWMCGIERR